MSNKVIYIDPNQIIKTVNGNNNILQSGIMNAPEDLSISVDLEVTTVSRYSYGSIKDGTNSQTYTMSWFSSPNGNQMSSFFQGKKIGGTNVLTDFYTDISYQTSQTGENIEGVGISSIDIDFDAWYLPQVTIKFVDVRGTALFTPSDTNPKSLASEFFKCFFTFPYPIFKIQIKGFYGDAVTYDLYLIDFKAEFNSTTGNFEFNTKFIGYTYAFLSDIQFDLLVAAPYCDYGGTDYWDSRNFRFYDDNGDPEGTPMLKILDYVKKIEPVLTTINENIKNSDDGKKIERAKEEATNYNKIILAWNSFKNYFKDNWNKLGIFPDNIIPIVDENKIHFLYSDYNGFYFMQDDLKENFDNLVKQYPKNIDMPSIIKKIVDLGFLKPIDNIESTVSDVNSSLKSMSTKDKTLTNITNKKILLGIYEIDMNDNIATYQNIINNNNIIIKSSNTKIYNKISQGIQDTLGFKPTIQNIFALIFAHLETFANTFYKCTNSIKNRQVPSDLNIKYTDVASLNLLPPFPQYADNMGNDAWIGNQYPELEEVKYVNSLLNSITQVAKTETAINQDIINNNNNTIDHIPITPFDIDTNPYLRVDSIDDLKLTVILRMFQAYICGKYYFDQRLSSSNFIPFYKFGISEAYNIYSALKSNSAIMNFFTDINNNENLINSTYNGTLDLINYFNNINLSVPHSHSGKLIHPIKIYKDFNTYNYVYDYIKYKDNFYYLPLFSDVSNQNLTKYFYSNLSSNEVSIKFDGNQNYAAINITSGTTISDDEVSITVSDIPIQITDFNYSYFKIYSDTESAKLLNIQNYLNSYQSGKYKDMVKNWNFSNTDDGKYLNAPLSTSIDVYKLFYYFIDKTTKLYDGINEPDKQFNVADVISVYKINNNRQVVDPCYLPQSDIYHIQEGYGYLSLLNKALLVLHTLPIDKTCKNIFNLTDTIITIPKANLLYLGSVLWRFFYSNGDPLLSDIKNKSYINPKNYTLTSGDYFLGQLITYPNDPKDNFYKYSMSLDTMMKGIFGRDEKNYVKCNLKNNVIKVLINYFMTWALNNELIPALDASTYETVNENINISNNIKDLLSTKIYISLPNNSYTESVPDFNITNGDPVHYLKELVKEVNTLLNNDKTNNNVNTDNDSSEIIKKELYKTLKNLNDKWFASHDLDYYKINNFFEKSFIFIDKFYKNIGNELMVNLDYFLNIILQATDVNTSSNKLNDRSLYSVLTDILVKHNMLFLPAPNYLNITNTTVFENVFKPVPWYNKNPIHLQQSFFVCMAVGEPSSKLNLNNEYGDDGLMVASDGTINANKVEEKLPCFAVDYGVQNQSYFKNMQINMNNAVNTDQSLAAIYQLSNQGSGSARLAMGNNFYSVYTTNSYQVTVEMMGDAQVQQLMYFQLMNVPMFRGCYLIYKIQHKIVPGNMTTSFTGMRMTKFSPYINKDLFSLDKAGIMEVIPGMSYEGTNYNPYMQSLDLKNIKRAELQPKYSEGNDYVATTYYSVKDTDWIDYPTTYNKYTILASDILGNKITLGDFLVNVKDIGMFANNSSMFSKNQSAPSKGIPAEIYSNMRTLAGYFIKIKAKYGNNIAINSVWRDKYTENGRGSFHHVGCAVDFEVINDDKDSTKLQEIFNHIYDSKNNFKITELFLENQGSNRDHPIIHYAVSFSSTKQCIRNFTDQYGAKTASTTVNIDNCTD